MGREQFIQEQQAQCLIKASDIQGRNEAAIALKPGEGESS